MGLQRPIPAVPYALLRDQLRDDYPDLPLSTIEHALNSAVRAASALTTTADRHLAVLARDRLEAARARARAAMSTVHGGHRVARSA